jgi:hypothetical protein
MASDLKCNLPSFNPISMSATLKIFEAAKIPLDYKFVEMGKSVYLNGRSDGMVLYAMH